MPAVAPVLRASLEEFLAGEERARVERLRDPDDDHEPRSRARGRGLLSEAAAQRFEEARRAGELNDQERLWLRRHFETVEHLLATLAADARLRVTLARATLSSEPLELRALLSRLACADDGKRRASTARELELALRPMALEHVAAHARAEAPLLRARNAQPGSAGGTVTSIRPSGLLIASAFSVEAMSTPARPDLPNAPWLADAAAFLSQTDAAAEDAVRHCLRGFRPRTRIDWHLLLRGLRAVELDSSTAHKERWRRTAAWLRELGFEPTLQRMRAEPDRAGALPFADCIALSVPRDMRVAQISTDYGVISDVFAAEGVGRALGLSLVLSALPTELRWPAGACMAGVLGSLALQLFGERSHLTRVQDMTSAQAERVGRHAGTAGLLWVRAWVALALANVTDADDTQARLETLAEALGRALCCELPPGIAGLLGANRVRARGRAQELLVALALHIGLRDRFDSDWFRNPRSAELLRNMCERGNTLTPTDLCAELSIPLSAAITRAVTLVT